MTKRDQVTLVAQATGLSARHARDALDAVAAVVRVGLLEEGKVKLDGVGTFRVRRQSARTLMNPQTRVPMNVPAKAVVKFQPTPELRASVEDKHE
jgi:DNA-binding protein HU-beta